MFTGIIEAVGTVLKIDQEGTNRHFTIESKISDELKVDQSLSHNGVCLTVVDVSSGTHVVTAVEETLKRSNLGHLKQGSFVNLERAMISGARLDGHIVQGHVDGTGECIHAKNANGSWYFQFRYHSTPEHILVDKGSVCINGVSLTVVEPSEEQFSVAIIPYTFEHTTFRDMEKGDLVNLEFDILGKYIARYAELYMKKS